MRAPGTRHGGGMTFERLRSSVSRDAYSDYLPMVAWVEEEEAFLCIDDGWGQAWELVPSAYLFAHVHQALLGLLNIQFATGRVVQLHCFADPLIDEALDAFLDLKSRPDPLIQASARRTYARRAARVADALGPWLEGPPAGMYATVLLPPDLAVAAHERARTGGFDVPLLADYPRASDLTGLVVGFGGCSDDELDRALELLVAAVRA